MVMWETLLSELHTVNSFSAIVRLILALVLGGILGLDRGLKRRPAGLRTYMVVCVASSLVMLTGQYLSNDLGTGDPARLGAQVISGVGFLGAGTIIVTSRHVRGLTTAAGLWSSACIGLAVGAGFYTGAVVCGILQMMVMTVMSRLETRLHFRSRQIGFFVEFNSIDGLGRFISMMRTSGYKLHDIEVGRNKDTGDDLVGATFWIESDHPMDHIEFLESLGQFKEIKYLEELEAM